MQAREKNKRDDRTEFPVASDAPCKHSAGVCASARACVFMYAVIEVKGLSAPGS